MPQRGSYKTRQREDILACLSNNTQRYLTVDGVYEALRAAGSEIGRTTVYRNLEHLVAKHELLKAISPRGEALYRLSPEQNAAQLVCLECGKAFPLACNMVDDFTSHIKAHHGFEVDSHKTVLYGTCPDCLSHHTNH